MKLVKKIKKYWKAIAILGAVAGIAGFIFYITIWGEIPDSVISLFPSLELPTMGDRVLVFAPHPDDEILGSGSLILLSVREGAEVRVVVATNGNKNGLPVVRHAETIKALKVLGIPEANINFLDYPDGKLALNKSSLEEKVELIIGEFNPSIVVIPSPADYHKDHLVLGGVIDQYLKSVNYQGESLEYLIHYPKFPRPLGYYFNRNLLPPANLITSNRTWYKLSVSSEVESMKYEAVLEYKSQTQAQPWLKNLLFSFVRENELFSKL